MCAFVDEIDGCSQLHQQFTISFCANILAPKKLLSLTVIREKLFRTLSYEKGASKLLIKLTTGVLILA